MKRALYSTLVAALIIGVGGTAAPLRAQSSDNAWMRYNAEKKSEFAAAGLEWFIPLLGHAYVGNTKRGVKPALVTAGGFGGVIVGAVASGDVGTALVGLGLLTMVGGRVWGIVSALETAQNHNAELKKRLNLTIVPDFEQRGVRLGFAYPLRF